MPVSPSGCAAAANKERGPLASWLKIERLYLLTLLDQDLQQVAAECWEFLGKEPPKAQEPTPEQVTARQLDDMLRDRFVMTLMNLATRKNADATLTVRLQKYLDKGIAQEEEGARWKQLKYWLLIAQNRPKELEKTLGEWIQSGDADNHWRLSLGYVLAEQGRIPEAIKLLEAIEAHDELSPMAYQTLADWYLAANRREQHERALLAMYKTMDEWRDLPDAVCPDQLLAAHRPARAHHRRSNGVVDVQGTLGKSEFAAATSGLTPAVLSGQP